METADMDVQEDKRRCPWTELGPDGDGLVVHDFLTTRLSALMTALRRQMTTPYASQFGLSVPEWRVLSLIAHAGTLSFGDLVVQSTSDKALVSRTVRLLEGRGLIEVGPDGEAAKKRIACTITAQGKALHAQVMPIARKRQAEVIRALTPEERTVFFAAVEKLQAAVEK